MNEVALNSLVTYLLKCVFPCIQKQHQSPRALRSGLKTQPPARPWLVCTGVSLGLMEGIQGKESEKRHPLVLVHSIQLYSELCS